MDDFELLAKFENDKFYNVVTDYKKVPYLAYDEEGNNVWMQELDIYGKQMTFLGNSNFIPHRFAGQMYDPEIDLCYNRLRYYDCNTGTYISQDPLRINSRNYNFYKFVKDVNTVVDLFGIDWVYILVGKEGHYYTGHAAEGESMMDVARRHSNTVGSIDGPRFGEGDVLLRKTDIDLPIDPVRGLEQIGIDETGGKIGRSSEFRRGNNIDGISAKKQKTTVGQSRLNAGQTELDKAKVKKVSQLPNTGELSYDEFKAKSKAHH